MSVTRLLILGAVRIFQPAHGYLVRRELVSWEVDQWANVNPGSIYNALKTLTRDGLLATDESTPTPSAGQSARTAYRLTHDGEAAFQRLVRLAVWEVHPWEPAWLLAGMSFWWVMSRAEVLDALKARRTQLEGRISASGYAADTIRQIPFKPESLVEHFLLHTHQLHGELAWVDAVTKRIEADAYWFDGEEGSPVPGPPPGPVRDASALQANDISTAPH